MDDALRPEPERVASNAAPMVVCLLMLAAPLTSDLSALAAAVLALALIRRAPLRHAAVYRVAERALLVTGVLIAIGLGLAAVGAATTQRPAWWNAGAAAASDDIASMARFHLILVGCIACPLIAGLVCAGGGLFALIKLLSSPASPRPSPAAS